MSDWPPFVIFSLPRSRSAWLTAWLGGASGYPVGHDLAIESNTIDEWLETVFRKVRGTCETGAIEAWPILRRAIPQCRVAVIVRDIGEVTESLRQSGVPVDLTTLERRATALRDLSEHEGVLAVNFKELQNPRTCARLQEHCLGAGFNWPLWEEMDRTNIQIDMAARLSRLGERSASVETLKLEMAQRLHTSFPFVTIGEEPWTRVADECEAIGVAHHIEATEGREGPFLLNRTLITAMNAAGLWRSFVARVDGEIVGYCGWSHAENAEANSPPTMSQGPFYVARGHEKRGLGQKLLAASFAGLAASGYQIAKLHHTVYGRGARAGRLYERLGAIEHQREYHLRIA